MGKGGGGEGGGYAHVNYYKVNTCSFFHLQRFVLAFVQEVSVQVVYG